MRGHTVTGLAWRVAWGQLLGLVADAQGRDNEQRGIAAQRAMLAAHIDRITVARWPSGAATSSTRPRCPSPGEPRSAASGHPPRPGSAGRFNSKSAGGRPTRRPPGGMFALQAQHAGSGASTGAVATRRVLTRGDDLNGSRDAHTVRFGLEGEAYEIDPTDAHAQLFRDLLARYISAGLAPPQQDGANAILCR